MPCSLCFQSWSKCVDKEREAGGDFTEECREKVGCPQQGTELPQHRAEECRVLPISVPLWLDASPAYSM